MINNIWLDIGLAILGIITGTVLLYFLYYWISTSRSPVKNGVDEGKIIWSFEENGVKADIKGRTSNISETVFGAYPIKDFAISYKEQINTGEIVVQSDERQQLVQKFNEIIDDPKSVFNDGSYGLEFLVVRKLIIIFVVEDGKRFNDYVHPYRKGGLRPESLATMKEVDGLLLRLPKESKLKALKKINHLQNAIFIPREVLIQKGWIETLKNFVEKFERPLSLVPYLADIDNKVKHLGKRLNDEIREKKALMAQINAMGADALEDSEVAQIIRDRIKQKRRVIQGAKSTLSVAFPAVSFLIADYFGPNQAPILFSGVLTGTLLMVIMLYRR